ncbi:MAG: hydrogenase nickel incorporation protein HypB [Pirellulales bacterium]|nr:hydrogenase nickel incorporation protein HypB [Pirellulales bacterium]
MADIPVRKSVRSRNDEIAAENRGRFREAGLCVVNMLSSPGSGKTSLLERTAAHMKDRLRILVIDGDVETERDADRLRKAGLEAIQIQTHGSCHLSAAMIAEQIATVDLSAYDLLLIENIGNLVCPSNYDLGEARRVVVASTTEGDDKPIKYPEAYHTADLCVLNKVDLLPYLPFDVAAFEAGARRAKAGLPILQTSCTTDSGVDAWCRWLDDQVRAAEA